MPDGHAREILFMFAVDPAAAIGDNDDIGCLLGSAACETERAVIAQVAQVAQGGKESAAEERHRTSIAEKFSLQRRIS